MPKQLEIDIYKGSHGGRRPDSGRTRIHSRGVSHKNRERVTSRCPLHINFKLKAYLRTDLFISIFYNALENASAKGLIIVCYSIQSNHIHLIAEAKDNQTLYKGMRSLTNTIVKRIGKGSIQVERYHLHVLKSKAETRHAIIYVLNNDLKHTGKLNASFTGYYDEGKSWLLTSSLKDIASEALLRFPYP